MKKNCILTLITLLSAGVLHGQITQLTDINATGNSNIKNPAAYNGEVYFEADDGSTVGDELYKISADGTVSLFKDINQDPDDTSPNSDPSNFTEFNGLLYFNANSGDKTGSGKELWVTDGTEAGTVEVADINTEVGKGSNPLYPFVFNNKLYFQANDGSSTQWWSYDGVATTVKVTNLRSGGYATTSYPIIDEANNRVFFQAIADNGRMQLYVMGADESITEIIINSGNHGYTGREAILFNGSVIFQGDNGTDGDELWISDGTVAGTQMLLDINTTAAGDNSDPESFAIYNDKVYFVADPGTGTQLWETDGTTAGTKLVVSPNPGAEGSVEELKVYNGKLYFTADDGVNGAELWVYDGTTASLLADINVTAATGSDPAGYTEVDGLLFFEADDGTGTKLWVSDGTVENTIRVAEALNSATDPLDVNSSEFVVVGTLLYFTADDAFGDEFFVIDARKIFSSDVQFTVTDADGPVEGAEVEFNGEIVAADVDGKAWFEWVRQGDDLAYSVSMDRYFTSEGTVNVADDMIYEDVVLVPAPTYSVTFTVTDGTNALVGAEVAFKGETVATDAAGKAIFDELYPEAGIAYTVTLSGYENVSGTVDIVDANVSEDVALTLTTYTVTFNVTDGSGAVEGAAVAFNGTSETTDASGVALFEGVVPATGMAYTITKSDYLDATGTVDIDGDEVENVSLQATSVAGSMVRELTVYPNPSNGPVQIDGITPGSRYVVYSINQTMIRAGEMSGNTLHLELHPGVYILRVDAAEGLMMKKIVIR